MANDYNNKTYYWIKLQTNFFDKSSIDFLMSQKNGSDYVVLYQMLCLNTANNDGKLATKVGEMIVPYNVEKIQRDCKYFDIDTIMVALELYKQLGLIYQEEDGILKITDFNNMVGSITQNGLYKQEKRKQEIENRKLDLLGYDKWLEFVQLVSNKSIEIRD